MPWQLRLAKIALICTSEHLSPAVVQTWWNSNSPISEVQDSPYCRGELGQSHHPGIGDISQSANSADSRQEPVAKFPAALEDSEQNLEYSPEELQKQREKNR